MTAMEAKRPASPTIQDVHNHQTARKTGASAFEANQRETAQYVADMILELRNMARAAKLYKIMVPLEFAYYEAFSAANKVTIPPEELQRLKDIGKTAQSLEVEAGQAQE